MRLTRDKLNAYAAELHRPYRNGLTPYAAMGIIIRDARLPEIELHWPDADFHDSVAYDKLFQKTEVLKIHAEKCLPFMNTALRHMDNGQWSPLLQKEFESSAKTGLAVLREIGAQWQELFGQEAEIGADISLASQAAALSQILPSGFQCPQWIFAEQSAAASEGLKSALDLLCSIHDLENGLSPHVRSRYDTLMQLLAHMPMSTAKYRKFDQGVLAQFDLQNWSHDWEQALLAEAKAAIKNGEKLEKAAQTVSSLLEIEPITLINDSLQHWQSIAALLPDAHGHNWSWIASPQADPALGQLHRAATDLAELLKESAQLHASYDESIFSQDLKGLQLDWTASKASWFWKRNRIQKQVLETLGCTESECEADLPILVRLAAMRQSLEQYAQLAEASSGLWNGAKSEYAELAAALSFADRLKGYIASLPLSAREFNQLGKNIGNYIRDANAQLCESGSGRRAFVNFADAISDYLASIVKLKDLLKFDFGSMTLAESRSMLLD